jgi:hypothetical protein
MAQQVCVILSAAERQQLAAIAAFLNAVEHQVPAGKCSITMPRTSIPRCSLGCRAIRAGSFISPPTSASWLNAVENFFSKMTRQRIRRGVFRSIVDLQTAINAYLAEYNASPKPFVWTQSAEAILAKLDRLPVTSL